MKEKQQNKNIVSDKNSGILESPQPKIQKEENKSKDKAAFSQNSEEELEEMFKAGVHFAYSRTRRHPKMTPFIYGIRNNTEVFDLEKVYPFFQKAKEIMKESGKGKKQILFIGTKPGIKEIIKKTAEGLSMPYVSERWIGGTLTNFKVVRNRVSYFEKLMEEKKTGGLQKYTKKERTKINKEFGQLEKKFKSLILLTDLPDMLVVIDSKEENTAIKEAKRMLIPVIAVMNSDCNLEDANYPIPANDSAMKSVDYLLEKLVESYKEGLKTISNEE
jgi:small subunit ribosomal protein S2